MGTKLAGDSRLFPARALAHTERPILASVEAAASGTPVDTGRARYNYLASLNAPLQLSAVRPIPEFASASARENLAVGKNNERSLVRSVVSRTRRVLRRRRRADGFVYVTNNVGYVAELNRGGRSPQAPRGRFVERAGSVARRVFRGGLTRGR